jgi:hypothetical protein
MTTVRKTETEAKKKAIGPLSMGVHHRVIIKREWIIVRDAEVEKGQGPKLIKHAPYLLLIGTKSPVLLSGTLNEKSAFPLTMIPAGKTARILCLVPEKLPTDKKLPANFEQLVDAKGKPKAKMNWSRIFRLRSKAIAANPKDGTKVDTKPVDDDLTRFLTVSREANLLKLKSSALEACAPSKKEGVVDLDARLGIASAFHQVLAVAKYEKLAKKRIREFSRFLSPMPQIKSDYRLAMAFGKLLHLAQNPNIIHVASQHLVWSLARAIKAKTANLETKKVPSEFICLFVGLKLARKSVSEKQHTKPSGFASQQFAAYAVALGYQMLSTTSMALLDKNNRKAFAEATLKECYKVCSRQVIDDPSHTFYTTGQYFKTNQTGINKAKLKKAINKVKWGLVSKGHGEKFDWKASTETWRAKGVIGRNLESFCFLKTIVGNASAPIPMGAPSGPAKISYTPSGRKGEGFYEGYYVKTWDRQSYYIFRVVRSICNLLGSKALDSGSFLKGELRAVTKRRKIFTDYHLEENGAGWILENRSIRQRKYLLDIAARQALLKKGSFGSDEDAPLRKAINKDIKRGERRLLFEDQALQEECSRYIEFLSTPQVQGLVGALPLAVKKAWRTKAICPYAPQPFLGKLKISLRYWQMCVQPEAWSPSESIPQPLWSDRLDCLGTVPTDCKVGFDLQVWEELFPSIDHYRGTKYVQSLSATLLAALGLTSTNKLLIDLGKAVTKQAEIDQKTLAESGNLDFKAFMKKKRELAKKNILPLLVKALKDHSCLKLEEMAKNPLKKSVNNYKYLTQWGNRKAPVAKRRYVDWHKYNTKMGRGKVHQEQLVDILMAFFNSRSSYAMGKKMKTDKGRSMRAFEEVQLLAATADMSGTVSNHGAFWSDVGKETMRIMGGADDGIVVANALGPLSKGTTAALTKGVKGLKGAGKFLGPVALLFSLLSFGDLWNSEENNIAKGIAVVGLGAGAAGVMATKVALLSTNLAGWIILGLTAATIAGSYYFGSSSALKAAKKMGYTEKAGVWRCELIVPDYEFFFKRGSYQLVVYCPKRSAALTVKFREQLTFLGYDSVPLIAGDRTIKLSGKDGIAAKSVFHVAHISQEHTDALAKSAFDYDKSCYLKRNGYPTYPIIYWAAGTQKREKILPTKSIVTHKTKAQLLEVGDHGYLTYMRADWLKGFLKKYGTPKSRKAYGGIDHFFFCTVGRPTMETSKATCRLGMGGSGSDGRFPASSRVCFGSKQKEKLTTESTKFRGQDVVVVTDGTIGQSFRKRVIFIPGAHVMYTNSDAFRMSYHLPNARYARKSTPLAIEWDQRTGRLTRVADLFQGWDFSKDKKGTWSIDIRWATPNASLAFELWVDKPTLGLTNDVKIVQARPFNVGAQKTATLPMKVIQPLLKKAIADNGLSMNLYLYVGTLDAKGKFLWKWTGPTWSITVDKSGKITKAHLA